MTGQHRRRRARWARTGGALACLLALAAGQGVGQAARPTTHLAPQDGDLWTTIGYSVHPCNGVVMEPNLTDVPSEHHARVREMFQAVADVYNAMIGRTVFSVGANTSRGSRVADGHHVLKITVHGDPSQGVTTGRYASGMTGIVSTGTVDGNRHITDFGGEFDLEMNSVGFEISVDTMVHELGHGLGFHHTIDGRSIMSYSFNRRGRHGDDVYNLDRYGPVYTKATKHLFPADCAYATLGQNPDWRHGGPDKVGNGWFYGSRNAHAPALTDGVTSVVDIGVDLLDGPEPSSFTYRPDYPAPRDRIVVCRDDLFADCLGGAALAGRTGAVVFVEGGPDGRLSADLRDAMLGQTSFDTPVVVLGGPNAVSDEVVDDLQAAGFTDVSRLFGANRYATAAAVADRLVVEHGQPDLVILARGNDPADAVAAGAWAAREQVPVLLTDQPSLHPETATWMDANPPRRTLVVGGSPVISDAASAQAQARSQDISRAFGRNRRATSVAVAQHPWTWNRGVVTTSSRFYLVNGFDDATWALALAAAPWAASEEAPILLTSYGHLGMIQDGSDGTTPDPGWYFWNLDATTDYPQQDQWDGFVALGTPDGTCTEPDVMDTAQLTATALATYSVAGG